MKTNSGKMEIKEEEGQDKIKILCEKKGSSLTC
jgi:hypothetical protein